MLVLLMGRYACHSAHGDEENAEDTPWQMREQGTMAGSGHVVNDQKRKRTPAFMASGLERVRL